MKKEGSGNKTKKPHSKRPRQVIILGAGGRDFHNFNTYFRTRPCYRVIAFTATQIPYIADRNYPPRLAGPRYPKGIPIYPEEELPRLLSELPVDQVVFSYSDVSHEMLMDKASLVLSKGQDFIFLGPKETMIDSRVPVISVCAVRTGCGKSVITRKLASLLKKKGLKVSVIRHPMAYCEFKPVLRFSSGAEVEENTCTIEEREEFEPLVEAGITVYAGVDYERVLRAAERESEVIVWDGGNNDFPFIKSDWEIVLTDALRPGHEKLYYPGEVNFRRADLLIITKVNEGSEESLRKIRANISLMNPDAEVLEAPSVTWLDHPERIVDKKVLVIEDGPTITHGGMPDGAGASASRKVARELVDPRPYAVGSLREVYKHFPHIGRVLPAMGYSEDQIKDLEETIRQSVCDAVVVATPTDLGKKINIDQPIVRVSYDFNVDLLPVVDRFIERRVASQRRQRKSGNP
ncbi:MAG TPA: cyclic 2,3-diphosphoglycerate synthase [Thermodesulfobacteriota bacterium]|nr:cyclic 2,3-diphosphoglycerate synthase [Thermodesulfobacteriota bacterium]